MLGTDRLHDCPVFIDQLFTGKNDKCRHDSHYGATGNKSGGDKCTFFFTPGGKCFIFGAFSDEVGDQTANQFLVHALRHQRPDDGLLSEESKDTPERLGKSRVWIVDPVDGTRGYVSGRRYSIAVGLLIDYQPVAGLLGCVEYPDAGKQGVLVLTAA